mmetsp:Transcript_22946/g.58630  ORF Transcript_22946/g.58630 Transcript_22946/m.58630 type:complete len:864 (-) Transcript_22946:363-2954(-)|eukprot:CAMPEP_0202883332 /NCGR_PEP_ID=MMETSP1391-20130828/39289_1 /ASSEMBLY_ACC=CAM_ASM_000867 /TAXON_ID=1034604 /ORGANISM="Chlamydomonas leiostraca, Strain SAG 11-49" /LENGTH=863 /DNA_ID=CAMNT_0049566327 /DNA_START=66 /DNA_END=2657 /DNA_ORIENTATION=+
MAEWQDLLHQTQDLVAQDFHSFPQVERNITQLQQYAETLRARTNKFRTLNNQIAATRLLAQQGFDASRLTQEVTSLEIQPTIEDVFHADTTSVEDYLKQVEESTILAAISEAQNATVSAFESYMEDCMARDWAANKRQLFGLIAPHSGGGISSSSLQGGAAMPGVIIGAPASRESMPGAAALQLPPSEQAYVDVIRKANQAALANNQTFDLVKEFRDSCKTADDKRGGVGGGESSMRGCWALLADILAEAQARGATAVQGAKFVEALATGARKHLERGHATHMRTTVSRHKLAAERGADPDQLREVQAYIQVKLGGSGRGVLDFQQAGGVDTSWVQVFYCLRNGWYDAARRAADRAHDMALARFGEGGFRGVLDEWLRGGGRVGDKTAAHLARACETLMRDKASLKSQVRHPYMVLVLALLAGDARAADALTATLTQLQLPSVLATIEDYMWCKLTLFLASQSGAGGASTPGSSPLGGGFGASSIISGGSPLPPYGLAEFHADINRWPPSYYSKQGKEPLLYATVLLLSLQFQACLRFLWRDEATRGLRVDAVHLAIACHQEGLLGVAAPGAEAAPDVGSMIHAYGRKFVHHDSALALQYYMLAAHVRGNSVAVKGQLLRELLTESRDYGTLLGGGSGGALAGYVPDPEERKRLYEAVAYECQVAAQPEEAVELYLAADRPRQALAILCQQLSALMPRAAEEAATGVDATGAVEALRRVMLRGRDARSRVGLDAQGLGSRREVEAFDQLCAVWELLLASRKGRHELALQKLAELAFVPLERGRVEHCVRVAQGALHPTVQDRLQDVLAAAADTIAALKAGASRDRLFTLRNQLDALCGYANSAAFRVPKHVYQKLCETAAGLS